MTWPFKTVDVSRRTALRRLLASGASLAIPLGLPGCAFDSAKFRFRFSVSVRTPQGIVSGSSVLEDLASRFPSVGGPGISMTLRGEAVAIKLPSGTYLFATISSDLASLVPHLFLDHLIDDRSTVEGFRKLGGADGPKGERDLNPDQYPRLVSCFNLIDPDSVAVLDPGSLADAYGAGVFLDRMFVELTSDPVSRGIRAILPWLPTDRDQPINKPSQRQLGGYDTRLFSHDFSTGM